MRSIFLAVFQVENTFNLGQFANKSLHMLLHTHSFRVFIGGLVMSFLHWSLSAVPVSHSPDVGTHYI